MWNPEEVDSEARGGAVNLSSGNTGTENLVPVPRRVGGASFEYYSITGSVMTTHVLLGPSTSTY